MITLLATLLFKLTILRTKLAILLIKMTTPMNKLAILLVELTTELIRTMVFHLRGVCHQSFGDPSDSFDGFEFDWIINFLLSTTLISDFHLKEDMWPAEKSFRSFSLLLRLKFSPTC